MARKYGPRSRRPTGRAGAYRSASTVARAGSRWSPPSVVSRSDDRRTRSCGTANQSRQPPAAQSWSTGSWRAAASFAGKRTKCACTKSANSQISVSPDSQTSPEWGHIMTRRRRKTLIDRASAAAHTAAGAHPVGMERDQSGVTAAVPTPLDGAVEMAGTLLAAGRAWPSMSMICSLGSAAAYSQP